MKKKLKEKPEKLKWKLTKLKILWILKMLFKIDPLRHGNLYYIIGSNQKERKKICKKEIYNNTKKWNLIMKKKVCRKNKNIDIYKSFFNCFVCNFFYSCCY